MCLCSYDKQLSFHMRKPTIKVFYQLACTVTEADKNVEISDLRRRGIVLSVK